MSIFWLGGKEERIPHKKLKPEMYEDRIFHPGIIHGGDYLIRVYLNDASEDDMFAVDYLTRELILQAHKEDPSDGEAFNDIINCRAENFSCENGSGEFNEIFSHWDQTIPMTNSQLVLWAMSR